MKFKVSEIEIKDIDGHPLAVEGLHKAIANLVYMSAKNIDEHTFAMDLNKHGEAEITQEMAESVVKIVEGSGMYFFIKSAIINYLNNVK